MRKNRLVYKEQKSKVQARKLSLELELLEEMGGSPSIDLDPASDEEDRLRLEREKSLRAPLQQNETCQDDKEDDPCALMMDLAQYDETNPIMDWTRNLRTESEPLLDEGGSPSQFVRDIVRDVCSKRKTIKVSSLVRSKRVKRGKMAVLDEEAETSESEDDEEEDQESGDEEDVNDEEEEQIGEIPSPGRHIQGIEPGEEAELARVTEEAREACKSKRSAGHRSSCA
ncbi:hypothetical protein ZWY2020_022857 [Hordeum vulgare]|nr:hypothetical protein ZWY2020_054718 [Hordeum vulgare]KAI4982365.1 hypothetical protein ZWY2020_022857 [Hordeum vulgare]